MSNSKFWSKENNPIYYINGIDKCQDKRFIIREICKYSTEIFSKNRILCQCPRAAFYKELKFGGKWKSLDVGSHLYPDWDEILSIDFPHLEVLKYYGNNDEKLFESTKKLLLEKMPNLTTVIDTTDGDVEPSDSIRAFEFHPELKRIRTHLDNPDALANFPKGKPFPIINLLFERSSFPTPKDYDFKGYQIESLELITHEDDAFSVGLEHLVGIDDITTLHIGEPANKTLSLLKKFKKLKKISFNNVYNINNFTPLADPNLSITELMIYEDFNWLICSANILPRLRVLEIRSYEEYIKTNIINLTVFLKTRPHLRDIHLFVKNKWNEQDERLNFNARWRWKCCENPAEEFLTLFSDFDDGSRWIRVTYKANNKKYFAETNTSKVRQNSSFQLTLLK